MNIEAIYLAAGFGSRFGSNKLLYELEGKALYRYGLDMLSAAQKECVSISRITVVTQYAEIERYVEALPENQAGHIRCAQNSHSERGISSSLQIGILADEGCQADAYLFCVADAPYLSKETLLGMIKAFTESEKGILCAKAAGQRGNPVIFDKKYRQELLALTGDLGGRQILLAHPGDIKEFLLKDLHELLDIDYSKKS